MTLSVNRLFNETVWNRRPNELESPSTHLEFPRDLDLKNSQAYLIFLFLSVIILSPLLSNLS